ncbi:MAG: hypothetical protein ACLQIB_04955 [Isosphaeraceae bacterium]
MSVSYKITERIVLGLLSACLISVPWFLTQSPGLARAELTEPKADGDPGATLGTYQPVWTVDGNFYYVVNFKTAADLDTYTDSTKPWQHKVNYKGDDNTTATWANWKLIHKNRDKFWAIIRVTATQPTAPAVPTKVPGGAEAAQPAKRDGGKRGGTGGATVVITDDDRHIEYPVKGNLELVQIP